MPLGNALVEAKTKASRSGRCAGDEPIPGYRLSALLGEGRIGEVWKCLARDRVAAAMKIIRPPYSGDEGQSSAAERDRAAIKRIRTIHHASLLTVNRTEEVDGELFFITELADRSLRDELELHRNQGLPGIPDKIIMPFMVEAAEVLDAIFHDHGLQHLNVTPGNLLLVDGRVKLADFGLLSSVARGKLEGDPYWSHGFSPKYASPEVLSGGVSPFSDQYSLAIVYQELVTGNLPFDGDGLYEALTKRLNWVPNFEGLPDSDRPIVARAMSISPTRRFASCMEFVRALSPAGTRLRKPSPSVSEVDGNQSGPPRIVLPSSYDR
jgi:serine/threonine protein kinase